MAVSEARKPEARDPLIYPLSIQAYRTLGELGLIPKNTELLHGQVYKKTSKSPLHSAMVRRLLRLLGSTLSTLRRLIAAAGRSRPQATP